MVTLLVCGYRAAGQGTAFSYQGFLSDGGAPASGVYDLEFRVFDNLTAGTQQGVTVTVNDRGVTNGLFTVTVDPGVNVFTGAARWLNIAVRPGASSGSFTNVVPRQPITAAPYAITAGSVTGPINGSSIVNGSITGVKLAAGAVGATQIASNSITAGQLAGGAAAANLSASGQSAVPRDRDLSGLQECIAK